MNSENQNIAIFDRLMIHRHRSVWAENAIAKEAVRLWGKGLSVLRMEFLREWHEGRPDEKGPVDPQLVDRLAGLLSIWLAGRAAEVSAALQQRLRERMQEDFKAYLQAYHPVVKEDLEALKEALQEQATTDTLRAAVESGVSIEVPAEIEAEVLTDPTIWTELRRDEAIAMSKSGIIRSMAAAETAKLAWLRVTDGVDKAGTGIEVIARSQVESVINGISRQFAEAEKDIFPMEQYVATLDERCCLECASYDGNKYRVGEGPEPEIHPRCHCYRTPISPRWAGIADAEREAWIATEPDALVKGRRGQLTKIPGKKRRLRLKSDQPMRVPGRSEIKRIPAKVTYDEWLRRQPGDVQKMILGPSRYEIWTEGGRFPLKRFVGKDGVIKLTDLKLEKAA